MQADRTNWPSQDHDQIVKKSAAPCRSIIHHDAARRKPGFTINPTLFDVIAAFSLTAAAAAAAVMAA
ncbi:hypothetical protein V2A60_008125 [Cordyceps javanica]